MERQHTHTESLFSDYKQARANGREEEFWATIALQIAEQPTEERLSNQQTVRAGVDQILEKMIQIQQQLAATSELV